MDHESIFHGLVRFLLFVLQFILCESCLLKKKKTKKLSLEQIDSI